MARHLLPIAVLGFALVTITGFLMFTADAVALLTDTAFQIKLALIFCSPGLTRSPAIEAPFAPSRCGTGTLGRRVRPQSWDFAGSCSGWP